MKCYSEHSLIKMRDRFKDISFEIARCDYVTLIDELLHCYKLLDLAGDTLKFYGEEKKYFKINKTINLQQTTAIFHTSKPEELPVDYQAKTYECAASIKFDQGKRAREALKKLESDLE